MNTHKHPFLILTGGVLLALGTAATLTPRATAQPGSTLIHEIAAEHNRIRQNPKVVADELRHDRAALIKGRTVGIGNPDSAEDAAKAIDDCIKDLDALAAKHPGGLGKLDVAPAGNTYAQKCVETMPAGTHAAPLEINAGWKAAGYKGLATAESITSVPGHGSDKEKARAIVQGLLIDWGRYNIANGYGHRKFLLDYETPSAPPKPGYAKKFKALGVGISKSGAVRIQYGL